jgi:hypothetical protein
MGIRMRPCIRGLNAKSEGGWSERLVLQRRSRRSELHVLNQFPFPVKLSKLNLNSIVLGSLTTAYHKEYVTAE